MTTKTAAAPKFTPGPWCTMYDGRVIRGFDGSDVAQNVRGTFSDASLIATAPELYKALRECVFVIEQADQIAGNGESQCLIAARAALAKVQS